MLPAAAKRRARCSPKKPDAPVTSTGPSYRGAEGVCRLAMHSAQNAAAIARGRDALDESLQGVEVVAVPARLFQVDALLAHQIRKALVHAAHALVAALHDAGQVRGAVVEAEL